MKMLSNEEYTVDKDKLIYDSYKIIDATNVPVQVPEGSGILKRGQVIDFDDEKYKPHVENGTPNRIIATDTPYGEDDSEVVATTYISGDFRESACITGVELTVTDKENLRKSGIVLK